MTSSVDRDIHGLVQDGTLQKLSRGLFYYPKESVFCKMPPDGNDLVRTFLKDDHFLLTSPNLFNSLGVGTTQLHNQQVVYNHKRHGKFKLGNEEYDFRVKPRFPRKLTPEFLLVDLVNTLDNLAEDKKPGIEKCDNKGGQHGQEGAEKIGRPIWKRANKEILCPFDIGHYFLACVAACA